MKSIFERIIEKLESEAKRWEDSGTEYEDKCEIAVGRGLRNAIEIVKQEAERYEEGWSPCSERLPELTIKTTDGLSSSDVVLVTTVDDSGFITSSVDFLIGDMWATKMKNEKVIAWQPLPEPYKGE